MGGREGKGLGKGELGHCWDAACIGTLEVRNLDCQLNTVCPSRSKASKGPALARMLFTMVKRACIYI